MTVHEPGGLVATVTGTPKRGYACNTCLDWRTLTTVKTVGPGATDVRTIPCPACSAPTGRTP